MTWLVIGIALALPAILYILLSNLVLLGGNWDGKPRMSLYLKQEVTGVSGEALVARLRDKPEVAALRYISPEAALAEFQQNSGFSDVLASLPGNPLPAVIELTPAEVSTAELRLLVTQLEGLQEVDRVSVDIAWLERLHALLTLGQRFVTALAMFLGLGVVLAIGNTIRLAIENRRSEIEIVKLVGGTDAYVRRPFLYLGFWYGAGGALLAFLMVQVSLLFLSSPIERLLHSYQNQFQLSGLGPAESLLLFLVGTGLGSLGAAVAVSRHLHTIEPK